MSSETRGRPGCAHRGSRLPCSPGQHAGPRAHPLVLSRRSGCWGARARWAYLDAATDSGGPRSSPLPLSPRTYPPPPTRSGYGESYPPPPPAAPPPPRLLRDPGGEGRVAVARTESSFASYSPAKSASFLSRMGRGRGAACARGGGNSFPGELGAATRRSACPFFSSSPGLLLGAAGGRRGGGRMAARSAPQWGDRPPHARPAPRRAPGLLEWKSGDGARVPPPPPPRPWVGSRETCWRETRGDSHPPAALPRLP